MTGRFWIVSGALLAAAGVSAGAVGTHVLKEVYELSQSALDTYETAVRYQMYHSLALVLVGLLASRGRNGWLTAAGSLFLLGIVLFSGGIYVWLGTGATPAIQVVPIGGSAWIIGWLLLAIGGGRSNDGTGTAATERLAGERMTAPRA